MALVLPGLVAGHDLRELDISPTRPRLHQLREKEGRREIDLLAQMAGTDVVAIEVTASAAPDRSDARHLAWLRDALGDRFRFGVVLHTEPATIMLGDRILTLPIAALWGRYRPGVRLHLLRVLQVPVDRTGAP